MVSTCRGTHTKAKSVESPAKTVLSASCACWSYAFLAATNIPTRKKTMTKFTHVKKSTMYVKQFPIWGNKIEQTRDHLFHWHTTTRPSNNDLDLSNNNLSFFNYTTLHPSMSSYISIISFPNWGFCRLPKEICQKNRGVPY